MDKKKVGGKLVLIGLFIGSYIAGEKLAIRKIKKLKEKRDDTQRKIANLKDKCDKMQVKIEKLEAKIKLENDIEY